MSHMFHMFHMVLYTGLQMVCLMKPLVWRTATSHRSAFRHLTTALPQILLVFDVQTPNPVDLQDWIRVPIRVSDKDQLLSEVEEAKKAARCCEPGRVGLATGVKHTCLYLLYSSLSTYHQLYMYCIYDII